jgi:hypothetical protein
MTIPAREVSILIDRHEFFIQILSRASFVVTLGTRSDRHVRFQAAQRRGFRDVDVTGRTFRDVLFLLAATIVNEFRGDPYRRFLRCVRRGREFVTAVAVIGHWLLRFPVTVETRFVTGRSGLEHRSTLPVTDRATVIILRRVREPQHRDHILVPVVRKLDREL